MNTILTLIKLQFNAGVRLAREKSLSKTIFRWLIIGIVAVALLVAFVAIYHSLAQQFTVVEAGIDLTREFLTFTITGFMVIQTLFLIPMLIKVLDINNDRELLLKLPLTSRQIFISKIIVAYLFELVFASVILGPILIAYGIAVSTAWWFFVFLIPFFIIFTPVFPFFLAILVLFPIMKLAWFMKNRTSITTVVYLLGLVAGVVIYMLAVQSMVRPLVAEGFSQTLFYNAGTIQNTASFFYPARSFAQLLYGNLRIVFLHVGIILLSSVGLFAFAFYIASLKYKKFYMEEHSTISGFKAKSNYKGKSSVHAILDREILNIFRSSNYTFQFLLVVVITPLLIFFSNRIANYAVYQSFMNIGDATHAFGISFEISLFITMVLIPLASAFAASNISREGHNIYHTKLIPVSFRKQLFIKTAIVFIPIFVAIIAGVVLSMQRHEITAGAGYFVEGLTGREVITLLVIATAMAIGYICLGTYVDIRKPLCNQVGTGELTKSTGHTNLIILLGSIIGVGFGALGLFSVFSDSIGFAMDTDVFRAFLIAFSIVFGAVFAVLLFVDGPNKYRKLEQ